jgi:hypothetical protein
MRNTMSASGLLNALEKQATEKIRLFPLSQNFVLPILNFVLL